MKLPLSWLKEQIATSSTPEQIAQTLTLLGLEVDHITYEGVPLAPILEISFTPNLIHAASVRGIARELAAAEKKPILPFSATVEESSTLKIEDLLNVQIEDRTSCPRYCSRVVVNVHVAPSPPWLKERIEASGMRSVNNVVDITNYVMLELGQPLHAFDLDRIEGATIVVRKAVAHEKIVTLDNTEHELSNEMVVIASKSKPLAIAGIMGSLESEVTSATKRIVLEAAYFSPTQVRRTSKQLGLQTAASYRFERGADRTILPDALTYAASLVRTLCQGEVAKGIYDSNPLPFTHATIPLRIARIHQLLALSLNANEVEALLQRLEMVIVKNEGQVITVRPPSYRHDIVHEIDLIEEVARLYGYQNISSKTRGFWRRATLCSSPAYLFESKIRHLFLTCQLQEVINCDLISPKEAALVPEDVMSKESLISILNPSSIDHSLLRTSLLPGLLTTLKYNIDHGCENVRIFEVGRIHFKSKGHYLEPSMAALLLSGNSAPSFWQEKSQPVDFYELKGIVESLVQEFLEDPSLLSFRPSHFTNLHPGRQAHILYGEIPIGVLGALHPQLLETQEVKQNVFCAEINLDDMRLHLRGDKKMKPLPLYPASKRDWTLSLAKSQSIDEIFSLIKKSASSLLESVSLVDMYENEKLGANVVHATFRFCYRGHERTLALAEVEREHVMITQTVLQSL